MLNIIPGFGATAVNSIAAFVIAFLIMILFGGGFVRAMHTWQHGGQPIRDDGPKTHVVKAGTPTMGGILVIIAIVVAAIFTMDLHAGAPWVALAAMVAFGVIGFADDFGKVKKHNAYAGLTAAGRLVAEGIVAILIAYFANRFMSEYVPTLSVYIPVFHRFLHFGIWYFVFAYFVIVGSANAANITDGLDGMLSKIFLPVLIVMGVVLYAITHYNMAMGGLFIPGAITLAPVIAATAGAVLGFLWFNAKPAAIFMGDTGSLALGGLMGTIAMFMKSEIIVGIAAAMMVIILLSSFIQTTFFKITKHLTGTGRRVFKMAPLHHALELSGWAETKIVERFAILSVLFCTVALVLARI